jgi:hypothetical protein
MECHLHFLAAVKSNALQGYRNMNRLLFHFVRSKILRGSVWLRFF